MKKYVQEATDINVWTSLKEDTFDRGKDIREFIEGLELIEGNAFISLDAKWGDGKLFCQTDRGNIKIFPGKANGNGRKAIKGFRIIWVLKRKRSCKGDYSGAYLFAGLL